MPNLSWDKALSKNGAFLPHVQLKTLYPLVMEGALTRNLNLINDAIISAERPGLKTAMDFRDLV